MNTASPPDLSQVLPVALAGLDANCLALLRRRNLLRALVEQEVVAQAVAGVAVADEERDQVLSQYRKNQGLEADEEFQGFLERSALSADELAEQLLLPLKRQRCAQEWFGHKAEARFLNRKNQLDTVVYSLLRVRDRFLAQELYLRIAGGEANFADLAAEFAEGPERSTKGIVGPVPLTQAHPALAESLRTSVPGRLLQPVPIADWWLVVRLESYRPASFDPSMAAQMTNELMDAWVLEETTRIMASLSSHLAEGSEA